MMSCIPGGSLEEARSFQKSYDRFVALFADILTKFAVKNPNLV